jgi:hypothetical protein
MKKIKNILLITLVLFSGSLSALEWTPSKEMREFEFEITDLYYPLLSDQQTRELVAKMPYGLYIWGYYRGGISATHSGKHWKELVPYYLANLGLPSKTSKSPRSEWVQAVNAQIKDGKIRFKLPKEINIDDWCCGTGEKHLQDTHYHGSMSIEQLEISMPIGDLGKMLHEGLIRIGSEISNNNNYFTFRFSIVPYKGKEPSFNKDGFYTRQHTYVRDFRVPVYNAVINGGGGGIKGWAGIKLWAVGKISEVNKDGTLSDKPLVANDSQYGSDYLYDEPLLSKATKINSIPYGDKMDYINNIVNDGINVTLTQNIPENVGDLCARYIHRGPMEQFTLYGSAKYKSADSKKYDQPLATFFLGQTKTLGKLFRIDAGVNVSRTSYEYTLGINSDNTICAFEYGIQFHPDGARRYFGRPKADEKNFEKIEQLIWSNITDNNISSILQFEQDVEKWYQGQPEGEAKTAACKTLIAQAKHILTASEDQLNKEFDETYKTIGDQFNKIAKDGFYIGNKKDGKK